MPEEKIINEITTKLHYLHMTKEHRFDMIKVFKKALKQAREEKLNKLIDESNFIQLDKANEIQYGHQNDTLQMAYIRGRNEIINLIKKHLNEEEENGK